VVRPDEKANMSAGEIDPGGIVYGVEIRRVIKTRVGKIGISFEIATGENGFAIKTRVRKRNA
jgi:hypothetical protein